MGTFRKPKGSYARVGPDFFIEDTCMVGALYASTIGIGAAIELYNNATDGSYLHVYRVVVGNDAAGWYGAQVYQGNLGTNRTPGKPVIAGRRQPWGVLYAGDGGKTFTNTSDFPPPNYFDGDYVHAENQAGSQDTYTADGPIAVLPPKFALQFYTVIKSGATFNSIFNVTFYYLAANDPG